MKIKTEAFGLEAAVSATKSATTSHAALQDAIKVLLRTPADMLMPLAVRRCVDLGIEPLVVAKRLLVGDRDGGIVYALSASAVALAAQEQACASLLEVAWRQLSFERAVLFAGAGASFLVAQCKVPRLVVLGWVQQSWPSRDHTAMTRGALDHPQAKQLLLDALGTEHPLHAPMSFRPFQEGGS